MGGPPFIWLMEGNKSGLPQFTNSAPGNDARRCLAVVAKSHFLVELACGRVVAHDVKKGGFATLHCAVDQL